MVRRLSEMPCVMGDISKFSKSLSIGESSMPAFVALHKYLRVPGSKVLHALVATSVIEPQYCMSLRQYLQ